MERALRDHLQSLLHDDCLYAVRKAGSQQAEWLVRVDVEPFGRARDSHLDYAVVMADDVFIVTRRELLPYLHHDIA